jgi:hypothetical protein
MLAIAVSRDAIPTATEIAMTAQIRRSYGKPSPMGRDDALACDRSNIQPGS